MTISDDVRKPTANSKGRSEDCWDVALKGLGKPLQSFGGPWKAPQVYDLGFRAFGLKRSGFRVNACILRVVQGFFFFVSTPSVASDQNLECSTAWTVHVIPARDPFHPYSQPILTRNSKTPRTRSPHTFSNKGILVTPTRKIRSHDFRGSCHQLAFMLPYALNSRPLNHRLVSPGAVK